MCRHSPRSAAARQREDLLRRKPRSADFQSAEARSGHLALEGRASWASARDHDREAAWRRCSARPPTQPLLVFPQRLEQEAKVLVGAPARRAHDQRSGVGIPGKAQVRPDFGSGLHSIGRGQRLERFAWPIPKDHTVQPEAILERFAHAVGDEQVHVRRSARHPFVPRNGANDRMPLVEPERQHRRRQVVPVDREARTSYARGEPGDRERRHTRRVLHEHDVRARSAPQKQGGKCPHEPDRANPCARDRPALGPRVRRLASRQPMDDDAGVRGDRPRQGRAVAACEVHVDALGCKCLGVEQHARAASEIADHDDGGAHVNGRAPGHAIGTAVASANRPRPAW